MAVSKLHYVETYKRNLLLHTDDGDVICYKNMKGDGKKTIVMVFSAATLGFL